MADRLKVAMRPKFEGPELTPVLCDKDGNALHGQTRVEITTGVDDAAYVTVTFADIEFI